MPLHISVCVLCRAAGDAGFTVLSCDNMPHNGKVVKQALLEFAAAARGDGLAQWIESSISCPNSMVDRITPTTADTDRQFLEEEFGVADQWPVTCEQFMQWVIEDQFVQGRPAWEDVGAIFVDDVYPYELMKLRCVSTLP